MSATTRLLAAVSANAPDGAGAGTIIALDESGALEALSAYFGAADDRTAVRVVVAGQEVGYVERDRALELLDAQTRELGSSSGWALPGVSDYEAIELHCDVAGCAANPIFAAGFDETYPPHCPVHPTQVLTSTRA